MLFVGCFLISAKEKGLITSCTQKKGIAEVTLAECIGFLSQYHGNAINYSPDTKDCNIKECKDGDAAWDSLVPFANPYDVYFCP